MKLSFRLDGELAKAFTAGLAKTGETPSVYARRLISAGLASSGGSRAEAIALEHLRVSLRSVYAAAGFAVDEVKQKAEDYIAKFLSSLEG